MACPPAWRILYHVIVSCKRPINTTPVGIVLNECGTLRRTLHDVTADWLAQLVEHWVIAAGGMHASNLVNFWT